jgi:hypothetical protein
MLLPIQLPEFASEHWRSLEKQLIKIANQEKEELEEPRDRKVYNVLAAVQYSAKSNRWQEVFKMLRDRGIIALKPCDYGLIQLLTAQKIAHLLASVPKLEARPIRVKVVIPKKRSLKFNPLIWFGVIKSIFTWIKETVQKYRLTPIFFQLTYQNNHGQYKLKSSVKAGANASKILTKKHFYKKKRLSTIEKGAKLIDIFDQILSDKWQDVGSLYRKFCAISDMPMVRSRFDDRLEYRFKKGEIFKHHPIDSNCAFYSFNPNADTFESEWMDLARAYAIAVSRGCKATSNTFRSKPLKPDCTPQGVQNYYKKFGIEFRFSVPEDENRLFKWRLIS